MRPTALEKINLRTRRARDEASDAAQNNRSGRRGTRRGWGSAGPVQR
jgi:hypothetical protein